MIELRVLGTIDLRNDRAGASVRPVLAQPKRLALLCYLALATPRGTHRRDKLLALLWPESPEDRARNSLNQAVFHLRRSLGEASILANAEEVVLGAEVGSDVAAFEGALARGEARQALEIYGGDLLPAFHLDGCGDFAQWLDGERSRLRRRAVEAALKASTELEQQGHGVAALELLRRATEWDRYDEAVRSRLALLMAELGSRSGALVELERFKTLLETELGIAPSRATLDLTDQLRRESPPQPAEGDPQRAVPAPIDPKRSRWRPGYGPVVVGAALAVLLVVLLRVNPGRDGSPGGPVPPLDPERVLVSAFENRTGEAGLEAVRYLISDRIAQGLAQSGIAQAVPFSTVVQETPHLQAEGVAPEVAGSASNRQLAERIGAGTVVIGSYYGTGNTVVFAAQIIDTRTGAVLRALDEVTAARANLWTAAGELQRRTTGALATLFDKRLASWPDPGGQPSSLESYRLFSEGMSTFMRAMSLSRETAAARQAFEAAARHFAAAAAADSSFVHAFLWAGFGYLNAGDSLRAAQILERFEGQPVSRWTRVVLNHQAAMLAHDRHSAYETARELADLSPDSEWLLKLALAAQEAGRPRESLEVFRRIDPDRGWIRGWQGYWGLRVELQHRLGAYEKAVADADRGLIANPNNNWVRTQQLWALAALGRGEDIVRRVRARLVEGDGRAWYDLRTTLDELRGHKQRRALKTVRQFALSVAPDSGLLSPARTFDRAELLLAAGESRAALRLYRALLDRQPDAVLVRVRVAALLAQDGDASTARETIAWLDTLTAPALERALPAALLGYFGSYDAWRHLLQARLAVTLGDRARAVTLLRQAVARGLRHTYLHLHADPDFAALQRQVYPS